MMIRAHSNLGPDHVEKVVNDISNIMSADLFFPGRTGQAGKPYQLLPKYCQNSADDYHRWRMGIGYAIG